MIFSLTNLKITQIVYIQTRTNTYKMPKTHAPNPSKDFHKAIRALIDNENFDEIFKSTETFVQSGGTPLPDTISTILANGDKYIPKDSSSSKVMLDYIISLIPEDNFTELTFTSLIKIYSNPDYFNAETFMDYYEKMKRSGIPVKRRTIAPIFQNVTDDEVDIAMFFYADAKAQNINLTVEDYINIFNLTHSGIRSIHSHLISLGRLMLVQDMAKTIDGPIPMKYLSDFDKIFGVAHSSFPPHHYVVPKKETNKMLEQMRTYVSHFYGRNPSTLSNIAKGMESLKKMKYTVVIDGANVGFYKQGCQSGKKISFTQLHNVVNYMVGIGYFPLVVLQKYHLDNATATEKPLIDAMYKNKKVNMFIVQKGADDDWFWLYAAISKANNTPRAYLLTNDEMRNHFHYMNLDQTFIDWKNTHVFNYDIDGGKLRLIEGDSRLMKIHLIDNTMHVPFIDDTKPPHGPRKPCISWRGYTF